MGWCIFYGDASTFSAEDGSPKDAPDRGVIAVVQDHIQPPQVLHQVDFYWWRGDHWCAGDIFGFLHQSAVYGATWVKQGETIPADAYRDILSAAVDLKDEWSR